MKKIECCHNCDERHIGCHGECGEYNRQKKTAVEETRDEFIDYQLNKTKRLKRYS